MPLKIIEPQKKFSSIYQHIQNLSIQESIIIGINGEDTSGKTIFALNFEKFLKEKGKITQLIHLDDFHNPSKLRRHEKSEIDAYINNAFNLAKLESEILFPFKNQGYVDKELTLLNLIRDTFNKRVRYKASRETIGTY